MGDNIVENWLKSLDLVNYAQAFLDNGYDDLEICKQVGEPDLDAIGVQSKEDRIKLIDAVKTLNEKGGVAVYLTLEDESDTSKNATEHVPIRPTLDNLLSDVPPPSPSPARGTRLDSTTNGDANQPPLVTFPKLQLTVMLRDKLLDDQIDLANPPYTLQNLSPCWSSLTALAVKYTEELETYLEDVLDRLEDLRWWRITEDTTSIYTPPSMTSSTMEDPYYPSLYSYSPRGGPPPIPSVPPPDGSHVTTPYGCDNYGQLQSVQTRYTDSPSHANYVPLDTGMCCVFQKKVTKGNDTDTLTEKKKTSTLGRLFRNMGFRKSSRKHSYKKHQGDPLAHEITMGDNDRIALMQMVKEGKISTDTALQVVKRFEEEKRKDDPHEVVKEKEKKSKSKKGNSNKPTKSPSLIITDDCRCEVCNNVINNQPSTPTGQGQQLYGYHDNCCRHRRVHSVSHIAYNDPLRSPGTARAMSCSPMRSHSTQPSTVNSPVSYGVMNQGQGSKIYTPVIPHELKMYSGSRALYAVHGIDVLRDRLNVIKTNACVHKTQSKASLISSESDHSMECASHLTNQNELQPEETYYCSNNSTVSMGSDTAPGVNGRRKCGSTMEKLRTHKWQRTGSLSQGEDCMSTDTDELDDPDRLLLGGGTSSNHMMEKFRDVRNEMRKRILHTRDMIGDGKSHHLCSAYQTAPGTSHSVSSTDSCSSGHGSQSSHAHTWNDLEPGGQSTVQGQWNGPVLGHARVHSNYSPAPEEKDFMFLRRGERVQLLETSNSGIWKGRIDNRVGYFHFNFVDMITETTPISNRKEKSMRRRMNRRSKPRSVEELLQRIGLEHLTPVFMMNGYDNLDIFADIDHEDLNALNILDSESRTKLVTAAELLMDYEDLDRVPPEPMRTVRSVTTTPTTQQYAVPWTSFFPSKPLTGSRDSGCYDSNEFMNRGEDPYASAARLRAQNLNTDNKENLRPSSVKKTIKNGTESVCDPNLNGANSNANKLNVHVEKKVLNGSKPEKIYSEEDREVCNITGYQGNQGERSSPRIQDLSLVNGHSAKKDHSTVERNLSLNIPVLGPDWKLYNDCGSQTSPKYSSLSDSYHGSIDGDPNNPNSSMSASAHGDFFSQTNSTLKTKSKPYARKIAPIVAMKDMQVQVMCPLGVFPQSFSPTNLLLEPTVSQPTSIVHTQCQGLDLQSYAIQTGTSSKRETLSQNQSVSQTAFQVNQQNGNQSDYRQAGSLIHLQSQQTATSSFQNTYHGNIPVPEQTESLVKPDVSPARISYVSQNSRDGDSGSDASTVKSDRTSDQQGQASPDIFGPIHKGFKSIKRSVIPKVTSKLASENINLDQEPYSSQTGTCGIPPLLVQRYAEELKLDVYKTALILDQVRMHKLSTVGRPVVVAEQLTEANLTTSELKIASIPEFFLSIGLPMYSESFLSKGYITVESLANLSIKELQMISKADRKHLKRIIHALEWVQNRLSSPSRKTKVSPVKDRV